MLLGSALKATNIPGTGIIISAIAVIILVASRAYLDFFGAQITIGLITALLKLFGSVGGVVITPMLAILMEAILFDVVISIVRFNRRGAAIAGMMPPVWSFAQPFITFPLLFGLPLDRYYANLLELFGSPLGIGEDALVFVLVIALVIYAAAGAAGGLIGWVTSKYLREVTAR